MGMKEINIETTKHLHLQFHKIFLDFYIKFGMMGLTTAPILSPKGHFNRSVIINVSVEYRQFVFN